MNVRARLIRIAAGLAAAAATSGAAFGDAAKPQVEMHRTQATEKDESGWYLAKSTKGGFRILSPIPFNDYTIVTEDRNIGRLTLHGVGSKSADGMEFGAIETVRADRQKDVDLRDLIAGVARKQGAAVPEVRLESVGKEEVAFAAFESSSRGVVMRVSKTGTSVFNVVCEYPLAIAEAAKLTCKGYVDSFRAD